jgi:transcriptional regulator with XRE-family HTH domain
MIPSRLVKWRKDHGFTQKALAEKLGVAEVTVYRWEKAMRGIPSFLGLALESIESRGGELKAKGKKKEKGGEKVNGNDLQKRQYSLD